MAQQDERMEYGTWSDGYTAYNLRLAVRRRRHPAKAAGVSTSGDSTGGIALCAAVNHLFCGPSPEVTNGTSMKLDRTTREENGLFNYF